MLKVSFFNGQTEHGPSVIPLFGPADSYFEKVAEPGILPEVSAYIAGLRPRPDSQYMLACALGAGEYYSSNVNGDHFPESALIHKPDDWTNNAALDAIRAADWPYGFPTFYNAQVFAHHRNKDASKGFGGVELAAWNPYMKRVELVTRLDRDKCLAFGGSGTWDKLKAGEFPDLSMGCKVPFDTCSICLDWEKYEEAKATFDPSRHKHPGDAILEFHKRLKEGGQRGIRGLSITRKDYCQHAREMMNRILPDGRKVFVYNDYPRFFDISYVFIGADKIAKAMLKIAAEGKNYFFAKQASDESRVVGSAEIADALGFEEKVANVDKKAKQKSGEITKDVVPSQFAGKAVPLLTQNEPDLPKDVLDLLGGSPLDSALSTPSGLGMVLRPREFQRIILIQMGKRPLADELEGKGEVFPKVEEAEEMPVSEDSFNPSLARRILPFLSDRSALGPLIEKRVVVLAGGSPESVDTPSSHPSDLLRKIGAAYNGYRNGLMHLVASSPTLISKTAGFKDGELHKLAHTAPTDLITPLSFMYLKEAFYNECSVGDTCTGVVKVGEDIRRKPACKGDSP